jgi:hypothetical protein
MPYSPSNNENFLLSAIANELDFGIRAATTATRFDFTGTSPGIGSSLAPASTSRAMLSIYNIGPAILYIGLGSTQVSSTNFTYLLNAGDTYVANPNEVGLEHQAIFPSAGSNAEVTIGS